MLCKDITCFTTKCLDTSRIDRFRHSAFSPWGPTTIGRITTVRAAMQVPSPRSVTRTLFVKLDVQSTPVVSLAFGELSLSTVEDAV